MAGIKVSVEFKGVSKALRGSPKIFETELRKSIKSGLELIQRSAGEKHRFVTRSGNLERSIQVDNTDVLRKGGKVFLDLGIAIYARRIHKGFGTWRMDPFLFEAARRKTREVVNLIIKGIGIAILKAGLK